MIEPEKALKGRSAMHRRAALIGALGLTGLDIGAWLIWSPLGVILFGLECVAGAAFYVWLGNEFGRIARGEPSQVGSQVLKEINLRKSTKEDL